MVAGGKDADIRAVLLAALEQLQHLSRDSAQARAPVQLDQQAVGRLSRMDAMQQQAMAQAEEGRRRIQCLRLQAALRRLDAGEYGDCLDCGEAIAPARLHLDPAAERCIVCAENRAR